MPIQSISYFALPSSGIFTTLSRRLFARLSSCYFNLSSHRIFALASSRPLDLSSRGERFVRVRGIQLFLSLFIFMAGNCALAADADELINLLNNTQTMQATFEQSSINSKGAKIGQKTTGKMALKRPGKFRWDVTKPNKQLLIISDNKSLLYDEDLEQVIKRKMDSRNPGNPAMLLSSATDSLAQSFKIVKAKKSDADLGSWFMLTPKTQNSRENGYQWIKIYFINDKLNAMQIGDNLGQKTIINFSNVIFNSQISPKTFVFIPPSNTEVFDAD